MFPRLPLVDWPTYGLVLAVGFLVGWWIAGRAAPKAGLDGNVVRENVVLAALAGLVGAKLVLVAVEPQLLLEDPIAGLVSLLTQAGVFYGGLTAAILTVLWRTHRLGISPHDFGDACAPAVAAGHAIGRIGCFLAGCCWGGHCTLPWAVRYTDEAAVVVRSAPLLHGVPLHPTQLYEVGANLLLLAATWWILSRRPFPGAAWWSYLALYGAFRVGIETLRADPRGAIGPLSTSQWFGIAAVLLGASMLIIQALRSRGAGGGSHEEGEADEESARADGAGATSS